MKFCPTFPPTHTHTLGPPGPTTGGVVYTRWGRTTCSNTTGTQLVYTGRAAGSYHTANGGGANYLCLPEQHSTPPSPLGLRVQEHTCMELNMRLDILLQEILVLVHLVLSMTTMSHVQCVTLQHEDLF